MYLFCYKRTFASEICSPDFILLRKMPIQISLCFKTAKVSPKSPPWSAHRHLFADIRQKSPPLSSWGGDNWLAFSKEFCISFYICCFSSFRIVMLFKNIFVTIVAEVITHRKSGVMKYKRMQLICNSSWNAKEKSNLFLCGKWTWEIWSSLLIISVCDVSAGRCPTSRLPCSTDSYFHPLVFEFVSWVDEG